MVNGQSITLFPSDSLLFSRTNIPTIPPIKYSTDSGFFLYTFSLPFSFLYCFHQIYRDVIFDCLLSPIAVLGLIEMKEKQKKNCRRHNGPEKFTISNNINNFKFINQSHINQFSKRYWVSDRPCNDQFGSNKTNERWADKKKSVDWTPNGVLNASLCSSTTNSRKQQRKKKRAPPARETSQLRYKTLIGSSLYLLMMMKRLEKLPMYSKKSLTGGGGWIVSSTGGSTKGDSE